MKELDPIKPQIDDTADVIKFPKSMQGMGEINRPHAGMTCYACDLVTHKIEPVKIKQTTLPQVRTSKNKMALVAQNVLTQKEVHNQVIFDPKKWYVWAINEKNANKKFQRFLKQLKRIKMMKKNANNSR